MVIAKTYSYNVFLIPASSGYSAEIDITPDIPDGLPLFTDTGGDEINSATFTITSPKGKYLTQHPIIQDYDHFRIVATDSEDNKYDREFEYAPAPNALVIEEHSKKGTLVHLTLLGIEWITQWINHAKPFRFENGFNVIRDLGDSLNASLGSAQPRLSGHDADFSINTRLGNAAPKFTANNYPFGLNPESVFDRMREMTDSLGAVVEAGGANDFFGLGFDTGGNTHNRLKLRFFSLGVTPANPITLTKGMLTTGEGERETGFAPPVANRIIGWFADDAGSLPVNHSKYIGRALRYQYVPEWKNGQKYPKDAEVKYDGYVQKSLVDNNSATPPLGTAGSNVYWQIFTIADYIGSIQYSPWTDDKATLWQNCGIDPTNSSRWGQSMPDSNIVSWDDGYFATMVDYTTTDPDNIPGNQKYGGVKFHRGYRVLCRGIGTGDFAGFTNQIMQWTGHSWAVKYQIGDGQTGLIVTNFYNGNGYKYDHLKNMWEDRTDYAETRYAIHPYTSITNVQGPDQRTTFMRTNRDSAVQIAYDYLGADFRLFPNKLDGTVNREFFRPAACLAFRFPFPPNNRNGIAEDVGELYGGTVSSGAEPATFDAENMHYTHDGKRGFNNDSSADLGPTDGIEFANRLLWKIGSKKVVDGQFKMRCTIIDTDDNVRVADYDIPYLGVWENIFLSWGDFKPYRGRRPKGITDYFIPPKQLEEVDEFRWWNIKMIIFQLNDLYDEHGRYDPVANEIFSSLNPVVLLLKGAVGATIEIAVDSIRFRKPLLVTSAPNYTRNIEKEINEDDITTWPNAESYVKSQEERLKHPKKEMILDVTGRFDIRYGDTIYYQNPKTINLNDNGNNTIKLVVNRAEHGIVPGQGFRTKLIVSKRFE